MSSTLAVVLAMAGCSDVAPQPVMIGTAGSGGVANSASGAAGMAGSSAGTTAAAGMSSGGGGSGNGGGGSGTAGSAGSSGSGGTGGSVVEVSSEGDGDTVVGPEYPKDPNLTDLENPRGKSFGFTLQSQDSLIFDGTDSTLSKPVVQENWERDVDVYIPAQYQDGDEAPILVIQEGQRPDAVGQLENISYALDNLTLADDPLQKLPAFIAIAVENGDDRDNADGKGSERGLEYDTLSDRYTRFIDTEVLPAVLADPEIKAAYPNLAFTQDPNGRATMGCSSGAAAAFTMGWLGNTFNRVISYSGTLVAQQNESQVEAEMYPFGAWEYHSELELIQNAEQKPLRIFLHVSENDNGADADESGHHNWVMANQRTAEDLSAKGYHYRYVFSEDTGHCDGKVFDLTLAETLSWVWRGYPTN